MTTHPQLHARQQGSNTQPRWRVRHAARILAAGGLVAHPTEGVWGIACDPRQPGAVLTMLAAKRRDPGKGLILIAHEASALATFIDGPLPAAALADWPGPETWLLPAAQATPWWLTGDHDTIAVRVTAHATARDLCAAFGGPLVSTSANQAGRPAARNPWQARAALGNRIDWFLGGGVDQPGVPSRIRTVDGRVVRGGGP